MPRAFVIRPFDKKKDTAGKEIDFERVHNELIAPALKTIGFAGSTTGEILDTGNIREDMFSLIVEADLVICDVTVHNANVFYELGIRHSLRKRSTILIKGKPSADQTPFDLLTDRYLTYDVDNPGTTRQALVAMINATLRSDRETDSPVFKMVPSLPEVDSTRVQVVPLDFSEEVKRAQTAKSKGWLRLLSQDVRGLRFEQTGLQLIAKAQWNLGDYKGAQVSLELIRDTYRDSIEANLMLANIYERLSKKGVNPELLLFSDQAIERVLANKNLDSESSVEALALKGRNQKTRWRLEFAGQSPVSRCREIAMNINLRLSYEAYRAAFNKDLNHFWSGLAALQMATIFMDLSSGENDAWKSSFDNDEQADTYRTKLARDVETLKIVLPASIEAKSSQLKIPDPGRVWLEISKADLLFLTEKSGQRVINRYKDVIPNDNPFAWDAAKGQLELFAGLGVKEELANQVIKAMDDKLKEADNAPGSTTDQPAKPVHIVVFAGHRTDLPGRTEARFPANRVDRAKELIKKFLAEIVVESQIRGFSSAAPGSDILFHQACDELGIQSSICLPMPKNDYAGVTFTDFSDIDWRSQFQDLMQSGRRILELSDRDGLPCWLDGAKVDLWERGNRWVMEMAQAADAPQMTLLALWDRQIEGDAPGGTADMINLAKKAGNMKIKIIDTKDLLA